VFEDNKTFINNGAREGFCLSVICIHMYPGSRYVCVMSLWCWKSCSESCKMISLIVSSSVMPSTFRMRVRKIISEVMGREVKGREGNSK
jgi:hypothetical protein